MSMTFDVEFEDWGLQQYDGKLRRKHLGFRVFSKQFNHKFTGKFKGKKAVIWNQYVCWFNSNRSEAGRNMAFVQKACAKGSASITQKRKSPRSKKDPFPLGQAGSVPSGRNFNEFRTYVKDNFPFYDASSRGVSAAWKQYKLLGKAAPSTAKTRARKSPIGAPIPTQSQVLSFAAGITTRQLTYALFAREIAAAARGRGFRWGVGNTSGKGTNKVTTNFTRNQKLAWDAYKPRTGWVSQAKGGSRRSPTITPLIRSQPRSSSSASPTQRRNLKDAAARVIRNSIPRSSTSEVAKSILQISDNAGLTVDDAESLQQELDEGSATM